MQTTITASLIENQFDIISQLDSVVILHNTVQRTLYKDIVSYCINHKVKSLPKNKINNLKQNYQINYPINARQYNSIYSDLIGKISSVLELNKNLIVDLKDNIKSLDKSIKSKQKNLELINEKLKLNKDLTKPELANLSNLKTKLFYLNKKLNNSKVKLNNLLHAQETNNPQLCFGSKKLFNQQFLIGTNNNLSQFKTHQDWLNSWIESRNKTFVLVGSSDETVGNQNCQIKHISDNIYELKVNLNPKALKLTERTVNIKIKVHNDKNELIKNILNNNLKQAISYRFYKDYKSNIYKVFISLDKSKQKPNTISNKQIGSIGIDINANHLSIAETNNHGNLVKAFDIELNLKDKSSNQSLDNIACAIKKITDYAVSKNKPIVIEKLNFSNKKKELKSGFNKTYNAMLSSFAYSKIIELIKSRSYDKGIEVIEINPAYTSKIGKFKYQNKYKLTTHQAAALVIARRGLLSYDKSVEVKDKKTGEIKSNKIIVINKEKTISIQLSKYYPFELPARNSQKQDNNYWKEIEQNYLKAKRHRVLSKKKNTFIPDNPRLSCETTQVADNFEVDR